MVDFRVAAEVEVFADAAEVEWDLSVGDELRRSEIHVRFGGSTQGGIAPAPKSSSLLLFTSTAGAKYGYGHDGWRDEGSYHYTGEGQVGDQQLVRRNKTILTTERPLRLFKEVRGGFYEYLGIFTLDPDPDKQWYRADALDINEEWRSVIMFRLWPVAAKVAASKTSRNTEPEEYSIPVESHQTEKYVSKPKKGFTVAERSEADLVKRYEAVLRERGGEVTSREIRMPGDTPSIYTDLFDEELGELIEAKSSASRNHVRLALGQILDYARYVKHRSLAVLVPSRPADDLVSLLAAHGVSCIYEASKAKFERLEARLIEPIGS
ncbi:hypothetical protein [Saccharopolyspora sp. NPDC050642]|uniref:hypothetical protein n=1 Tax=Saccharopolyspora sp. NPDC050642 TaxID=3157099 RepID=UPI0033FB5164